MNKNLFWAGIIALTVAVPAMAKTDGLRFDPQSTLLSN